MSTEKIKNIIVPVIVTIVLMIGVEWSARYTLARIYDRQFDRHLIVAHRYGASSGLVPDASGMVWGKPFHTNKAGERKNKQTRSGKRKILIIGDSVTEGVGVGDTETFASLIDEWSDAATAVENISLIGWSVSDYRNVIDQVTGQDMDTAVRSVYLFYTLNDIYGSTKTADLPMIGNKGVISILNEFLQKKCATYRLIKLYTYQNSDHYFRYDRSFYLDSARVGAVMNDLEYIKNRCDERKVDLKVFILPYRPQLTDPGDNLPQAVLGRYLAADGIPYHDLLPDLMQAGEPRSLYLFADEIHLSVAGHRAVAAAVVRTN